MKIELIRSEQLESEGPKTWHIVSINGNRKHFTHEEDAQKYYAHAVEFYKTHGSLRPIEETIASEEINNQ